MLGLLLNLFFAWWMWNLSKDYFEAGHDTLGWIGIAISAGNFAAAMALIF